MKAHLEPLAIAANVAQAGYTRLDHVLLMLGNLVRIYTAAVDLETSVRNVVLASIERRWAKQNQPAYILAVLFNPYVRARAFNPEAVSRNDFVFMAKRMFFRFFEVKPQATFSVAVLDYIEGVGQFSDEAMMLADRKEEFEGRDEDIDLVSIWRGIDRSDDPICTGPNGVVKLARRLLSVIANSAGCERLFSQFGITHTKIRNRLSTQTVHKTAVVKMDIQQSHADAGLIRTRLKRKFGDDEPASSPTLSPSTDDNNDDDTEVDFRETHAELIADAVQSEISESEISESETSSAGASPTATSSVEASLPGMSCLATRVSIRLDKLFRFPSDSTADTPLEFYWKGGMRNLDQELARYDFAHLHDLC